MESFWKFRAITLPNYAPKMSDRATLRKLKAMILSEYALEMPGWTVFWKLRAIILRNYAPKMSDVGTLGSARP